MINHHKWVATDMDPVSAPQGSNFYVRIFRAFFMVPVGVWKREETRILKTQGHQSWFLTLIYNKMIPYLIIDVFILFSIYTLFGMGGIKVQAMTNLFAIIWGEGVNYIEHYGLRREKDEQGIYESVQCQHAWSADASPVFARIQRHSDHHAHKFRPYQVMRRLERAPTMPYEYLVMYLIAFIPPLYRYVMDPRVNSINDAKKGIRNPDAWNNEMPPSEADKFRHKVVVVYMSFIVVAITYLTMIV